MKFLIFSLILLNFSTSIFGRICSKLVPVRVTSSVLRRSASITTYRNWIGNINTQWTPYTYTEIKYDVITRLEYDCCAGYTHVGTLCMPSCPSGCPDNSFCIDPFKCKCHDGYVWAFNMEDERYCKPKCNNVCPKYSNCTAPETCSCFPGYDFSVDEKECLPICNQICPENAYCSKPNECKCNEGYEMIITNDTIQICQPLCSNGCQLHAHCISPNECSCDNGYKMIDGYCEPYCEPACESHNVCFERNHCVCVGGYEFNVKENKCTPVCSVGCPAYSVCVNAETCECELGYKMNEDSTQCNPICTTTCPDHSVCYEPDKCLCDEGYRLKQLPDLNRTLECEALCPDNCLPYGKCDPLKGCECYPGYDLRMDLFNTKEPLCQPACSQSCKNGFCFSPDMCVCNPGYLMDPKKVCRATCSMGCINGDCIEPEICVCNEGYRLKANSVHECVPICEPECLHGDCAAPNFCLCWEDYQPTADFDFQSGCEPICEPNCQNAICISPNNCSCLSGYKTNPRNVNECVKIDEIEENTMSSLETTNDEVSSSTEYLTTLTTKEDDVEFLQDLPGTECFPYCKCWQIVGNATTLSATKCANICVDGADNPCLALQSCVCNVSMFSLNCILEEEKHENDENSTIEYFCAKPFQRPMKTTKEKQTIAPVSPTKFPWLIILGCGLVAMIVLVVISVVWTLIRKQSEGNYIVEYENR